MSVRVQAGARTCTHTCMHTSKNVNKIKVKLKQQFIINFIGFINERVLLLNDQKLYTMTA